MALDFSQFEATLQAALDDDPDPKTALLLGKAIEATIGNQTVSDVQDAGAAQITDINNAAAALRSPDLTLLAARSLGAL